MKTKKYDHVNLEKKTLLFFQIGLAIALTISLISIEWTSTKSGEINNHVLANVQFDVEYVPITREKKIVPPPPKPKIIKQILFQETEKTNDEDFAVDADIDETTPTEFRASIDEEPEELEDIPLIFADEMPEFYGGTQALKRYLSAHLKYPQVAVNQNIIGRVYVRFLVTKTGKVDSVKVIRGVHRSLDKEALRVVKSLPDWKAGRQFGKPVSVWYTLPIHFNLKKF